MNQTIERIIPRKILLNPGPATTSERVKKSLLVSDICPREKEFGELLSQVRKKALRVVNGSGSYETVLIGSSGTGAVESCLSSCVSNDQKILIIENGAYGQRMGKICEALQIQYEKLIFEWGEEISLQRVDRYLEDNHDKFNVIAFVHHETTTGILNPIQELNTLIKKYNKVSMVDAMSSYAGVNINLEVSGVDYLMSSSNKCIHGMAGLGIVIIEKSEIERISSFPTKSFYFDLCKNLYSQKEKKQFLFTPPVQTLYALNEAFDEFFEAGGIEARSKHYSELYEAMHIGMMSLGFTPLLEKRLDSKVLTAFLEPKDESYSFESMHDYFFKNNITIYPGKVGDQQTFRISNIGDITQKDIQFFLKTMNDYITETGIQLK